MIGGPLLKELQKSAYDSLTPLTVNVELTYQCNERCKHCYVDFSAPPPLPASYWKKWLDELADMGVLILTISGGDPLLHPEFEVIYRYAHSKGFAIRLFTNCLKLDGRIMALFEECKPLNVQTSIYGHTAELHDSITQTPGSFDKTTAAVTGLISAGIPTLMKCSFLSENIDFAEEIHSLARGMGADFQATIKTMPARDGDETNTLLRPTRKQLQNHYRVSEAIVAHDESMAYPTKNAIEEREVDISKKKTHPCGAAVITMRLAPNGEVYPCVQYDKSGGDAKVSSIKEIWEKSPWFAYLRGLRQTDAKECQACSFKDDCFRCPADAYRETGDPLGCSQESLSLATAYAELKEESRSESGHF